MVQKYTAPVRVYKYPFELVMAAYEKRFPTCHLIPVFVSSDKIGENISEDGAIHEIERRCVINVDAPYLLRKITGVDHVLFIQRNTLDRRKRILKIEAWNESFSNHIHIHELCHYRATSDNENWTSFEQQASLEVKSFWGFEHVVEKLAVKHYSQNVKKGEEIIEFHISELAQEGVTFIAPFDHSLNGKHSSISDQANCENGDTEEECKEAKSNRTHRSDAPLQCDKGKNGLIRCERTNTNGCLHSSLDKEDYHRTKSLAEDACPTLHSASGRAVLAKSDSLGAKFTKEPPTNSRNVQLQSPS